MQVQGDKYLVVFDSEKATVLCSGLLDLRGKEGYNEITALLDTAINQINAPNTMTLNLKDLEFLNSSGITTLGGFIIKLRNKGNLKLVVQCSRKHSWQERSMKGLEKLMPEGLSLHFE